MIWPTYYCKRCQMVMHVNHMMFCGKPARTISTPNDTPAHEKAFLDSLDAANGSQGGKND